MLNIFMFVLSIALVFAFGAMGYHNYKTDGWGFVSILNFICVPLWFFNAIMALARIAA